MLLSSVSERLRDDEDIVFEAIKQDGYAIQYASERLKNDRETVLKVIKKDGYLLRYASTELRNNKGIVLEAVKNNTITLQFASDELQNNKELLEILEKSFSSDWHINSKNWYEDRMDFLANLREKEFMEKSIISSNKKTKKNKF